MAELVAAVDIGGTTVKGGLYDEAGTVFGERQLTTGATGGGVGLLNAVIGLVRRLIESAPGAVVAAGLVSPGAEARSGTVRRAVNLDWDDLPLAGAVREAVGIPVAVEHDVRAAARAEATFGAARGVSEVFFVALGTGVAGAHVVGGRAGVGATGRAGEFGHAVVRPGGRPCPCGQRGCLERYASAAAIVRRYAELGGSGPRDAAGIVAGVPGDAVARRVWHEAVDALAAGLTTVVAVLDPGAIVIGGGLSAAADELIHPLRDAMSRRATWRPVPAVRLGALGPSAGRHGAALLAWDLARDPARDPAERAGTPAAAAGDPAAAAGDPAAAAGDPAEAAKVPA